MSYNNEQYWNELVGNQMSLREVGWPEWTEAFNAARYKLTAEQTIETLQKIYASPPATILEIGCGIGFWTHILVDLYPNAQYTGVDISQKAVNNLQNKFADNKNVQITCADITNLSPNTLHQKYDLVICMEVLLHITQDNAWQNAIKNILNHSAKYTIISDPFLMWHGKEQSGNENNKIRAWQEYQQVISKANCDIVNIKPRSFLLDNNIDFKTKTGLKAWNLFFKVWHKLLKIQNEKLGFVLGKIAYTFDKWYCKLSKYGHSCRQVVIIKK